MPKKRIPIPSDFSKPKAGAYLKKDESSKPKQRTAKPKRSFSHKEEGSLKTNESKGGNYTSKDKSSHTAKEFKPIEKKYERKKSSDEKRPSRPDVFKDTAKRTSFKGPNDRKPFSDKQVLTPVPKATQEKLFEQMPLNKYIAHCGICSRRDAVDLIKQQKVKVNGAIFIEPGYKVQAKDEIQLEDKVIVPQRKFVYYLLNKPKDYITTTDDPEGRKTVLDLMSAAPENRIYPVGRLDRNTTGLLLLTNDGDLAQKLAHPKNKIKKVYQVVLDKPLQKSDFELIAAGITLEDGKAVVDDIAYTNFKDKKEIGIEIHIGRNRIVRRIFEHLNYQVKALDRVIYAGLTKKNLQRGKWRELDQKEVIFLKHFN